jgi:hypothetical protein
MVNLLIAIVLILAVIVLARVIRVFELGATLRGEDPSAVNENDNSTQATLLVFGGLGFMAYVFYHDFLGTGDSSNISF